MIDLTARVGAEEGQAEIRLVFIQSKIHLFIHSFIHSSIHSFIFFIHLHVEAAPLHILIYSFPSASGLTCKLPIVKMGSKVGLNRFREPKALCVSGGCFFCADFLTSREFVSHLP